MIIDKIETNIKRKLYLYETKNINISPTSSNVEFNVINVEPNITFQKILGFGGAFTESSGYTLSLVNEDIYNKILDDYFSKDGLNYSFGRLPIASCDFSLNSYSYSYKDDLSDFSIDRDMNYIIPTIKAAQNRNKDIKFVASPWSPPSFMKDNNSLYKGGKLKQEYKQIWANYLLKYVKEYKKLGINIDYMTIQNEPNASQSWESCRYSAEDEAALLKNYLYPTFRNDGIKTEFLIWDHNKDNIVTRVQDCLIKYGALDYATGIAFHWYTGSHFDNLKTLNKLFPDKIMIQTEGCAGYSKFNPKKELRDAQIYANEIIGDLNSGANGFIDWNLVLDYKGGPNHKKNYCDSPIMINKHYTRIY